MPKYRIHADSDDATRERILKAAILRFSTHSYEETGLRDLAADVGVDMAYVHRCFGSKEKLFYEAVKAVFQTDCVFIGDTKDLPSSLAKDILVERGDSEIRPFDIIVRSFSSPDASRVLRQAMADDFIAPLRESHAHISEKRAALIGAFLAGVGIFRDVVRAAPLQGMEDGELERLITQVIADLLFGELHDERTASAQREQWS